MPAVRAFALYAAASLLINFIMQVIANFRVAVAQWF